MNAMVRLVLAVVAFIATYFITYWLPFAFLPDSVPSIVPPVVALVCGVLAGRFVWRRTDVDAPGLLGAVVLGAVITGAIGFCGGFFGPLIFRPDANQGPLLGIFITGPLGFVLGGIGGAFSGPRVDGTSRARSGRRSYVGRTFRCARSAGLKSGPTIRVAS